MDQVMVKIASDETLINRCLLLVVKLSVSGKLPLSELKNLPKNLNNSLMNIFSKRGYLTDQNIEVLVKFKFLRDTTRCLELSECLVLTDLSLDKISAVCRNLSKIDLNSNNSPRELITSNGISNLARNCKNLHSIFLRRCVLVDDSCIETIAQNCPRLSHLNIANCPLLTNASLAALGRSCRYLKSINFSATKVTDLGVFALFSSTSNVSKTIEEIHMAHCDSLSDESIECILLNSKKIKYLIFHSCPLITDESRIALEDYMMTNSEQKVKQLSWTIY